jgi:hypothetical protein
MALMPGRLAFFASCPAFLILTFGREGYFSTRQGKDLFI